MATPVHHQEPGEALTKRPWKKYRTTCPETLSDLRQEPSRVLFGLPEKWQMRRKAFRRAMALLVPVRATLSSVFFREDGAITGKPSAVRGCFEDGGAAGGCIDISGAVNPQGSPDEEIPW
ncbi:hypothetical protein GSU68_04815 [Rathayibacter sp. VKM Ac-2759]|uniref:hypothetical protein n=1 Tax=Rathayibacter sp. VKM Ac-2759 TaxID=2609252 RepID=UPI0013183007|nr:hypothetical protein [Rathayibacter sp. VKM Ac-2759]QHC65970.1 hypothetical protein GSU68_04815 [Rathayibacter sp. VKM Ac-2759]